MDTNKIDKQLLKTIIKEVIKEDIGLFKETLKEILRENQIIGPNAQKDRRQKLEKMIDEDFEQYDEVFKALA